MKKDRSFNPAALSALSKGDFENALIAQTPGGIERQEAEGQKIFVEGMLIPVEWLDCTIEDIEKLGFQIDKSRVIDDLFYQAKLPEGWKKKATEHSMWSVIVDKNGKERIQIFYKAAFYDRRAHGTLGS